MQSDQIVGFICFINNQCIFYYCFLISAYDKSTSDLVMRCYSCNHSVVLILISNFWNTV